MILLKAVKHTYPVRDVLKENGFKWNASDGCWEALFNNRREYHLFMAHFLDDQVYNPDVHCRVEFKAYEVDEEDLKPESVKELELLRSVLLGIDGMKSVEEIEEDGRKGLKLEGATSRIYWYDEVKIDFLLREIDTYECELKVLKKLHAFNVETKKEKKHVRENLIEKLCLPLYRFLLKRKRKLDKRHRKFYEDEVEIIYNHKPEKIKPVENNEIAILRSEQGQESS